MHPINNVVSLGGELACLKLKIVTPAEFNRSYCNITVVLWTIAALNLNCMY